MSKNTLNNRFFSKRLKIKQTPRRSKRNSRCTLISRLSELFSKWEKLVSRLAWSHNWLCPFKGEEHWSLLHPRYRVCPKKSKMMAGKAEPISPRVEESICLHRHRMLHFDHLCWYLTSECYVWGHCNERTWPNDLGRWSQCNPEVPCSFKPSLSPQFRFVCVTSFACLLHVLFLTFSER